MLLLDLTTRYFLLGLEFSYFPTILKRGSTISSVVSWEFGMYFEYSDNSNFDGIQQNDPTCPDYKIHEHSRLDFL